MLDETEPVWVDDEDSGEPRLFWRHEWEELTFTRHGYGGNEYERILLNKQTHDFVSMYSGDYNALRSKVKRLSPEAVVRWCIEQNVMIPSQLGDLRQKFAFHPSDPAKQTPMAEILKGLPPSPMTGVGKQPSDDLMKGYSDPDNYRRNVWLYEQRRAFKTLPQIKVELEEKASVEDWAPLGSDSGINLAIKSIASYHGWPILIGVPGRPKTKPADPVLAPEKPASYEDDDVPF